MLGEGTVVYEPKVDGDVGSEADGRVDGDVDWSVSSVFSLSVDATDSG